MRKQYNFQTGRLGESTAKEYLEKKGYKILERNYRTRYAEIDLVVQHGDSLVFVEVRTKTGDRFGTPEESLTPWKKERLRRNAAAYVAKANWTGPYRLDAVCIVLKPDQSIERLAHYEHIES